MYIIVALLLFFGLVLLYIRADLLVCGVLSFAEVFGVSDAVIGHRIVSIGTSLPELATSVVA